MPRADRLAQLYENAQRNIFGAVVAIYPIIKKKDSIMRTAVISHKLLPHIVGYMKKLSGFRVLHLHKKINRQKPAMEQQRTCLWSA
jgi:hypothetical protein